MARFSQISLSLAALAIVIASGAAAKDKRETDSTTPPAAYQAVLDCQKITDSAARLACFDRAVGTMAAASLNKDLVIIDRATIRETKRGLFGISLPRIKLFGGNDDVEVNSIESTITAAHAARDGNSVFVLADGSRWKQTDGRFTFPKPGQPITVKRAALGSFIANINKQPGVKVIRLPEN